jgi:hypothetical protein
VELLHEKGALSEKGGQVPILWIAISAESFKTIFSHKL